MTPARLSVALTVLLAALALTAPAANAKPTPSGVRHLHLKFGPLAVQPGHHVFHAAEPLAGRVQQRTADQRREMQDRFGHPPEIGRQASACRPIRAKRGTSANETAWANSPGP